MTKTVCGGSAAAILLVTLTFYTDSSFAEQLSSNPQSPDPQQKNDPPASPPLDAANITASKIVHDTGRLAADKNNNPIDPDAVTDRKPEPPPRPFVATAYNLRGRTASGKRVSRGIIAADRKMLPLGTRVRLDAGRYSGEYLVADTGGAVRGRTIDIWVPHYNEARRFGRRKVKLTVLGYKRKDKRLTSNPSVK